MPVVRDNNSEAQEDPGYSGSYSCPLTFLTFSEKIDALRKPLVVLEKY